MSIKTVKFTGLSGTTLDNTALGGIRFYDENNTVIPSGAIIESSSRSAETDNFLLTSNSTENSIYYYVVNAFNTNAPQTGNYADRCYWMSKYENKTLTCEFKTPVSQINKIEFVPVPDAERTDIGVDEQFNIELWDEFDTLINTNTITPITTNNTVQTVDISVDDITISMGTITNTSAEVLIDIILSQSTSVSYSVEYTTDDTFNTGIQTTSEKVVTTNNEYSELITGLSEGIDYYYRVVANFNVSGEFISSIENFKSYSVITVFIVFFGQANVTAKALRIANIKTTILSSLNMIVNAGVIGSWIELLTEEGAWKKYEGN